MTVPRDGDQLCPTGAVRLMGRRGVVDRHRASCTWSGKGHCTWCDKLVTESRRTLWCSQWCVDAFSATQPDRQRAKVQTRDRSVCALCKVNTCRLGRVARRYYEMGKGPRDRRRAHRLADLMTWLGWPTSRENIVHLLHTRLVWWDMDHTIPISEGGHPYDLRNLRTLCYWCHGRVTAEGSARRADQRHRVKERDAAQQGLFEERVRLADE